MAKSAFAWTTLAVALQGDRLMFRNGRKFYGVVLSEIMSDGSAVEVFRDRKLFDSGKAVNLGGHDGRVLFFGLDKIVKQKDRVYAKASPDLHPEWFELGDKLRLNIEPSVFRATHTVPF